MNFNHLRARFCSTGTKNEREKLVSQPFTKSEVFGNVVQPLSSGVSKPCGATLPPGVHLLHCSHTYAQLNLAFLPFAISDGVKGPADLLCCCFYSM